MLGPSCAPAAVGIYQTGRLQRDTERRYTETLRVRGDKSSVLPGSRRIFG